MGDPERDWRIWGNTDPYYGVLARPQFRRSALDEYSLRQFFLSGQMHVDHVVDVLRRHFPHDHKLNHVLDYGCGVGRLVIPFAERFEHVTGIDLSPSMLEEASRNTIQRNLQNVQLLSADKLDCLPAHSFDLIHSYIVFQHIPVNRGKRILRRLLEILKPGGLGAIHVTFLRDASLARRVAAELRKRSDIVHRTLNFVRRRPLSDPPMQMNAYSLNNIFAMLFSQSCGPVYTEFFSQGDMRGIMLYFEKHSIPFS